MSYHRLNHLEELIKVYLAEKSGGESSPVQGTKIIQIILIGQDPNINMVHFRLIGIKSNYPDSV